ncbi:MAG: M48 family metallopeptidase [Gemmataceae bacterium]|nr:M48 family metallopeptidase [Gemmataceae bacterium]
MATFRDLIAINRRNSVLLVAVFVLFIAVVALVFSLAILMWVMPDTDVSTHVWHALGVGGIAMIVAMGLAALSYYEGDQLVLGVSGAAPLKKEQDPQLYNVVEEMAIAAGLPMPKVYLIPSDAPNAFATGRDPQHASVAITSGLRTKLDREELQGVMAHEMAHIRNLDIRLMLLMAVLIGAVAMLSDFFWNILRFGSSSRSSSNSSGGSKEKGSGPLGLVIFVLAIVLSILAPILARLIQFAVSRQREYLADATGVQLTRNPLGLANALKKLEADTTELKLANQATAHLYIVNPVAKFRSLGDSLFASHPPTQDRIARLLEMAGEKSGK